MFIVRVTHVSPQVFLYTVLYWADPFLAFVNARSLAVWCVNWFLCFFPSFFFLSVLFASFLVYIHFFNFFLFLSWFFSGFPFLFVSSIFLVFFLYTFNIFHIHETFYIYHWIIFCEHVEYFLNTWFLKYMF